MNQTIPNIPVLATQINDTDLFEKADGPTSGQSQRVAASLFQTYISNGFTVTQATVDAIFAWGDNIGDVSEVDISSPSMLWHASTLMQFQSDANMSFSASNILSFAGATINFSTVPNITGGATGTFTTVDLKTVTVTNGIITSIV